MQISEIFRSLQGEGIDIGLPTIFVRTAGCNLRCEWCDTKYAWEGGKKMSVGEVKSKIEGFEGHRVCITGGEPLLQEDLLELIDSLSTHYEITVETNGSLDISELVERNLKVSMDYKTPSSKMEGEMKKENLAFLREKDQLKFVITDGEDYEYSKQVLKKYDPVCEVIFQAEESGNLKEMAETVLEDDLDVRVLPQLHKIIWGDRRGV